METSFREVAHCIDRLYPPSSLRVLSNRFRYLNVAPGELSEEAAVSFRMLASRIYGQGSKKIEFLHYNTWLLSDTLRIKDIIKLLAGTYGYNNLINCLGLSYSKIIAKLMEKFVTSGLCYKICDYISPPIFSVCGVHASSVKTTTPP